MSPIRRNIIIYVHIANILCLAKAQTTDIQLKIGYASPYWPTRAGPAVTVAIKRFLNETKDSSPVFNISLYPIGPAFTPIEGVPAVLQLHDLHVDGFVGPGRSTVCEAAGYAISYWDAPFFPEVCSGPELADKSIYTTMVRVHPSFSKTGGAVQQLFRQYNWNTTFMMTAQGFCDMGAVGIHDSLIEDDITIAEWIRMPSDPNKLTDADIDQYLTRARSRTRIIILCHTTIARRRIMYRAQDFGMTNGDYVFLYYWLLPGIEIFEPWIYVPSFETNEPPIWTNAQEKEYRLQAWYAYKQVTIANMMPDKMAKQSMIYQQESRLMPWNFTEKQAKSKTLIDMYNAYAEDAAYAYLLTVQKAVRVGDNYRSGRVLMKHARGLNFQGATGKVMIGDDGDRDPEFWIWSYGPGQTQAEPYAEIKIIGLHQKDIQVIGHAYWQTTNGNPPSDRPACGFRGEKCPTDNTGRVVGITVSVVIGILCFLVLWGTVYYKRKQQYEKELQMMIWKVNFTELGFIHSGKITATRSTLGTASCAWSHAGSEHHTNQPGVTKAQLRGMAVVVRNVHRTEIILSRTDLMLLRELRNMNQSNVNPFLGACLDLEHACVVEMFCQKGTLQDIIHDDDIKLDWTFKMSLVMDLVNGMLFIHKSMFEYHGSLTSSHCLVDSRWVLKVAGLAHRVLPVEHGTGKAQSEYERSSRLLWTAPELLRQRTKSEKENGKNILVGTKDADVYSFAIIYQEILYRELPYFGFLEPQDILARVQEPVDGKPYRPVPPFDVVDLESSSQRSAITALMTECWSETPEHRPHFTDIRDRMKHINKGKNVNIMDNMLTMLEKYANNLEDIVRSRTADLIEEKKKTDRLLYQMLPQSVADKLKIGKVVEAEVFEAVTIYFSDIVGFTNLCSESNPMEVIGVLNDLYTAFDDTISNHDVYKVETIGDAYMVVSGLPKKNGDRHVQAICNMALALQTSAATFTVRHRPDYRLQIRIGLHTGPCAAGVVGLKMPRYCLFGDTVNMASRMESTGEALKIHISSATHIALQSYPQFTTELSGTTFVKGKGDITTYWLLDMMLLAD